MLDVLVQALGVIPDPADEASDGPRPGFAESRGDGVLDLVGELVPPSGEKFDAVVRHRVVTRRQHDAEVGVERSGEIGNRWGRQNAEARTSTPALAKPATTAASRNSPEARGSRPTTASGRWPSNTPAWARTCAAATARSRASSAVRSRFAMPRTPSVPKSRGVDASPVPAAVPETATLATAWSTAAPCGPSSGRTSYVRPPVHPE